MSTHNSWPGPGLHLASAAAAPGSRVHLQQQSAGLWHPGHQSCSHWGLDLRCSGQWQSCLPHRLPTAAGLAPVPLSSTVAGPLCWQTLQWQETKVQHLRRKSPTDRHARGVLAFYRTPGVAARAVECRWSDNVVPQLPTVTMTLEVFRSAVVITYAGDMITIHVNKSLITTLHKELCLHLTFPFITSVMYHAKVVRRGGFKFKSTRGIGSLNVVFPGWGKPNSGFQRDNF